MPLDHLYRLITDSREYFYRSGLFSSHTLPGKTISIGNITTGGTGKTPLVIHTAKLLHETGEKVCVLTRGYGRENSGEQVVVSDGQNVIDDVRRTGDEALEIAMRLREIACVIANSDRVAAANFAKENFSATAFILDDAFQHFRVKRDLDVVCVDATNPFGNRRMLPFGILREPLGNLRRANVVVITRTELTEDLSALEAEISSLNPAAKIFRAKNQLITTRRHGDAATRRFENTGRVFAFCAIGNPKSFFEDMRLSGFQIAGEKSFRDHAFYSEDILNEIERDARICGAEALLTTTKDAVKFPPHEFKIPCYVAEMELRINRADEFCALITNTTQK